MSLQTKIVETLKRILLPSGITIVHSFPAQLYKPQPPFPSLPSFSRQRTLAVCIGTTKDMWAPFIRTLARIPALLESLHPLNNYVETTIHQAVLNLIHDLDLEEYKKDTETNTNSNFKTHNNSTTTTTNSNSNRSIQWDIRYSHQGMKANESHLFVAFQQLASVSGGWVYDNVSRLCLHPIHGPWVGLRAVIIFDIDYEGPNPEIPVLSIPQDSLNDIAREMDILLNKINCNETVEWLEWLRIRDMISKVGNADYCWDQWRYEMNELKYHGTFDKEILKMAIIERESGYSLVYPHNSVIE